MSDEQIIDLQKRVEALERFASDYRLSVALRSQRQRERQYHLLQAAATLSATRSSVVVADVVRDAEALLAEIEKRENAEAKS